MNVVEACGNGTWLIDNATVQADSIRVGTVTVGGISSGSVSVNAAEIVVGADGYASGVWTQKSGTTTVTGSLILGEYDHTNSPPQPAGSGELRLDGGTVATPSIRTRTVYDGQVRGPASGTVKFNGGVLQAAADSDDFINADSSSGTMTLSVLGGGAKIDTNGYAVTLKLPLAHGGTASADGGLAKLGDGTLTLQAANTYTGDTVVSGGKLRVDNPNAIPTGTGKGDVVNDGTLDLHGFDVTINGLSGSGTVTNSVSGRTVTLRIGNTGKTSRYPGVISNGGDDVAVTKIAHGRATLGGANTYAGVTTVQAGTLELELAAQDVVFYLGGADIQAQSLGGGVVGPRNLFSTMQAASILRPSSGHC